MRSAFVLLLVMAACGCSGPAGEPGGGGRADAPANLLPRSVPAASEQAGPAAPAYPPAVRQPTQKEAERVAGECGTRARPATMPPGLLRLAAWAVYEPVDATPAQAECFHHRIRLLVSRAAPR